MRISREAWEYETQNRELIDMLIAISVVSRRLAAKLVKEMEVTTNGKDE